MKLLVREALGEAEHRLAAAGVDSPRFDAEVLACLVLRVEKGELDRDASLDAADTEALQALVGQRCQRVPLQHITGIAPFRYLELRVGPGVFVPRPETEVVVGAAIEHLLGSRQPHKVLDLCAGSGAISLSLATEVPGTLVLAVEESTEAISWLELNLAAHESRLQQSGSTVTVLQADVMQPVNDWPGWVPGDFEVVISNPPYVPDDASIRSAEVAEYDPPRALFAGKDGLDVIRRVIEVAADSLRSEGMLVIEHADEQGEEAESGGVPWLIRRDGRFKQVKDRHDLNSRPRFTTARRI